MYSGSHGYITASVKTRMQRRAAHIDGFDLQRARDWVPVKDWRARDSKVKLPGDFVQRLRGQGKLGRAIGIALAGGTTEHIIKADQRPPTASHRLYSTSRDGQTAIRIELIEGASTQTAENSRVGGFVIDNLPNLPAGAITIDVYFELSTTGTLYVTAQERSSGQRAQGSFDLGN
jgi:hypothetical protein